MSDPKFFISEDIREFLPCKFSSIWKTDPPCLSLLSSLTCCILCQINRLKSSPLSKSLGQSLVLAIESIYEFASNIRSFQYILQNVNTFVDYSSKLAPDVFEKWIINYTNQLVDISVLLIAKALLDSGNYTEASNVIKLQIISRSNEEVFERLSYLLNIAIEVFYSKNEKQVFTCNTGGSEIILITLTIVPPLTSHEFGIPYHKLFIGVDNSEVLEGYPFTYTIPANNPPPQLINLDIKKPPKYALNATDNILIFIKEILKKRQWKFSRNQASELNTCLKQQTEEKIQECKEKNTFINSKLLKKSKLCEHPNLNYSILSCGRKHCIKCMKSDIKLRSLKLNQIFCQCKKKLNDKELKYYFKIGLEPLASAITNSSQVDPPRSQGSPQKVKSASHQVHQDPPAQPIIIPNNFPPIFKNNPLKPNDLPPDDPNKRTLSKKPEDLSSFSDSVSHQITPNLPTQPLIASSYTTSNPSNLPFIPQTLGIPNFIIPPPNDPKSIQALISQPQFPVTSKPSQTTTANFVPGPQFNFCMKCNKPVNLSEQMNMSGRYYHKACVNP